MPLGIMHDLAVGVHPSGADAWALQDVLALGVTTGAPPTSSISSVRTGHNLRGGRIGSRSSVTIPSARWWLPSCATQAGSGSTHHRNVPAVVDSQGEPPTKGAYVRYNHEAMIGIIALEAHRAGAVVVGEDLGTVEPWARHFLHERGLLGTSILWFEIDPGSRGPLEAERWRELCLSSVTTHDLPPTPGYLDAEHVKLRHSLGLLTRPVADEMADHRKNRRPGPLNCVGSACWAITPTGRPARRASS